MTIWESILTWFDGVKAEFILNFIDKSRWKLLLTGLGNTLIISLAACLMGIVIGVVIAVVRSTWENQGHHMKPSLSKTLLKFFNGNTFLWVVVQGRRGTEQSMWLLL